MSTINFSVRKAPRVREELGPLSVGVGSWRGPAENHFGFFGLLPQIQ